MADVTATWQWYPRGLLNVSKGNLGVTGVTASLKIALYHSNSNAYSGYETLDKKSALTGTVSGGNYADGTCSSIVATLDTTANTVELRFGDSITFGTTVTASAKFAVLYKDDANDYVVAYMRFPSVISADAGSITMNQNDSDNAAVTISYTQLT